MPDAAAIAALFLGQVEVAIAAVEPEHPLPPREAAALGRAVAVRRREFAAGRTCARRALAALGRPVDDLLRDADGLPAWPDGDRKSVV